MKEFSQLLKRNPGMNMVVSFKLVALVNIIVIWLANMLVPSNVVLGTMSLTPLWALVLSASVLSWFTVVLIPVIHEWEFRQKRDLTPVQWMAAYLVINFVGLWLLTRVSDIFGLGVSSWLIVLVLAAVLDFAQGMVMMQVERIRQG